MWRISVPRGKVTGYFFLHNTCTENQVAENCLYVVICCKSVIRSFIWGYDDEYDKSVSMKGKSYMPKYIIFIIMSSKFSV